MMRGQFKKIARWLNLTKLIRLRRWSIRGGGALLDQATFSGANFILSIILARWLSAEQFGVYAIGSTTLIVVCQIYVAFLLDPMSVLGPANFHNSLKEYLLVQLKGHFVITITMGLIIAAASLVWVRNNIILRQTLFVVGGTLPFLLLPWYLRRVFYVLGRPFISFLGSLIYATILIFLIVVLRQSNIVNSPLAIIITAIAGLFSGIFLLFMFGITKLSLPFITLIDILSQNWRLSKWLILSGFFIAFASQAQIWISAIFLDTQASGALRAMQVIIQPMMLTITAMTALVIPSLSFGFSKGEFRDFNRNIILLSGSLFAIGTLFEIILLIYYAQINLFIYAGKYSMYNSLLPIWGLVPIFLAFSSGIQAGFQAAQKPQVFLPASVIWFFTSIGLGIWLTPLFGIIGATWSAILGYFIFVLILTASYWIQIYRPLVASKIKAI